MLFILTGVHDDFVLLKLCKICSKITQNRSAEIRDIHKKRRSRDGELRSSKIRATAEDMPLGATRGRFPFNSCREEAVISKGKIGLPVAFPTADVDGLNAPRRTLRRERILSFFFRGSPPPSFGAPFSPPFRRFVAACGSSSTRRDRIALTTDTLASLSTYSDRATRLFLHLRTSCVSIEGTANSIRASSRLSSFNLKLEQFYQGIGERKLF